MSGAEPRSGLRDVQPYSSPQLDVPVRLNTNECPYPLPAGFVRDLTTAIEAISLNRYPDGAVTSLRAGLAAHAGHPIEGTWAANGSNEIIQQLLLAYGGPDRAAAVFTPTYELHSRLPWATHTGVVQIEVGLPYDISGAHIAAAVAAQPAVVFVCSPNNPTGNTQPASVVEELAEALPTSLIVMDEAYIEFGGQSALPLVATMPNVAVVRTLSKAFALAGARVGYVLADPVVVEDLRRVRLPYHLSGLTQAAGITALAHADDALRILDAVREQRDRILDGLAQMDGLTVFPSEANFVLFLPPGDAKAVWHSMLDRGVLIRDFTAMIPGAMRVNAGTPEETDAFLAAMKEVLA